MPSGGSAQGTSFSYDGANTRTGLTSSGQTTSYLQDTAGGLPVALQERVGTNTPSSYLYGLGTTSPMMQTTAGSVTAWYHSDALGSVRVISSSSASVLNTSSYSAYGTPTFTSGNTPNTHGYAGEQIDPTGLSYNRARYYDATLGRFTQRDTFAGRTSDPLSLNRHIYAKNSPTNAIDPSGWCTDLLSCTTEIGSRVVSSLDEITGPAKIIWQAAPAAAATAAGATTTGGGGGATLSAGGAAVAAVGGVLLGTAGACGAKATFAPQAFCLWNGNQPFNQSDDSKSCGAAGGDFGADDSGGQASGSDTGDDFGADETSPSPNEDSKGDIRDEYENEVRGLKNKAQQMRENGYSEEEIARTLYTDRRELGIKYKAMTPPDKLEEIYQRNEQKYGDKLGPSIDYLRGKGKSWSDIIDSATRPGGQDIVPRLRGRPE